ncbi:MAG: SDR family NAD(P)-dependent oxidoreductase [bacterium]
MKVLITGANGFIGSHLVKRFIDKGYEVRCLVRKTSNLEWLVSLQKTAGPGKIKFVYGDVIDKPSLYEAVRNVDYVYHVAGMIKSRRPQGYYNVNYTGTRNLIEVVKEINPALKKFIFISSLAAAGPSADGYPLTETDECRPITDYGKSKLKAEELLKNEFMSSIPIAIVRPPVIYGPQDKGFYYYFKVVKKRLVPVIGKKLSLCYITDLVDGIVLAGESEKAKGEIYFISSDELYSAEQVGEVIAGILGIKAVKVKIPSWLILTAGFFSQIITIGGGNMPIFNTQKARELVQSWWICDVSKAKRELGFQPKVNLQEGMRATVDWYVKNEWL